MPKGIQKKKDCFGCRAYWYDGHNHCDLHYKVGEGTAFDGRPPVPQDVCPKPRTYRDLARAEMK